MKQELDKTIPYGDVLYPTPEEFKDFNTFVIKLFQSPKYQHASLIKVGSKDRSSKRI